MVGFSAEHGCFVKPPVESQWVSLIEGFSLDWMVRNMIISSCWFVIPLSRTPAWTF